LDSFKVALISEEFPPFMFGGIASVCYDLAQALSKKGIHTTVFCGKSRKMAIEKINDKLEIVRLPCLNLPPRFVWFQLQNLKLFSKLLKHHTILHVVNPQAGASIVHVNRKLRKPIVTSIHGVHLISLKLSISSPLASWTMRDLGYQLFGFPLQELLYNICLRNSNHVAVCSFSTLAELRSLYPFLNLDKTSVIHNGINFDEVALNSKSIEKCSSIIFYGRLYWTKGLFYLIKAVANLEQDFPDLDVKIFGEGPLKEKIKRMVSALGLKEKISIRGFMPRNKLIEEIRKASIAVFPSLHEAQPICMLEAMACKKPVVAFDFPFSREIILDMYNGLLAKPGDVEDLSNKIRILLADKKLRLKLGQNAYDHVKKRHNWDTLVEKYIEVYRNIARTSSD